MKKLMRLEQFAGLAKDIVKRSGIDSCMSEAGIESFRSRHFRTPRGDIKTLKFIKSLAPFEAFLFFGGGRGEIILNTEI